MDAGVADRAGCDLLRGSGRQQLPSACAAFWPQIDDPIRGLDDIQVVFDDE